MTLKTQIVKMASTIPILWIVLFFSGCENKSIKSDSWANAESENEQEVVKTEPGTNSTEESNFIDTIQEVEEVDVGPPIESLTYKDDIKPLIEKYCFDCHGDGEDKGEVNLDSYTDLAAVLNDVPMWEGIQFNIDNWIMPPQKKKKQPTPAERHLITAWLESKLHPCDCDDPDPGRVTVRRLNRVEYNNTIRDLFGIDFEPGEDFPADDTAYGFDNNGDVLSISPILIEKYLNAADDVLEQSFSQDLETMVLTPGEFLATQLSGGQLVNDDKERKVLPANPVAVSYNFPANGKYTFFVKAYSTLMSKKPVKVHFNVGDETIKTTSLKASPSKVVGTLKLEHEVTSGEKEFTISFDDSFKGGNKKKNRGGLFILSVKIENPPGVAAVAQNQSIGKALIFGPKIPERKTEAYARNVIYRFACLAYRRFATNAEVDRLMSFYRQIKRDGNSFDESIKQTLKTILVSPRFLFRSEWQPDPNDPRAVHPVSEFDLASRLSYFLWTSMPDLPLLKLAAKKELRANLEEQVTRMLDDEKSVALVKNFAGQWLQLRDLEIAEPDVEYFPEFDERLKASMAKETELFFKHIVAKNRSILEFVNADYTFLNQRLAKHYGIPNVKGQKFRKVSLGNSPRASGLLAHASVLTITSMPTRTSPVLRGKWILENIMGTSPPPPPPNVPQIEEEKPDVATLSFREKLKEHRDNPDCASCHSLMDPLGFGLENFNAIGSWRTHDGKFKIDSSGILTTGEKFSGPYQLSQIIVNRKREKYVRAVIERMLNYALGRGIEYYDKCAIDEIYKNVKKDNYEIRTLILEIIKSTPFQMRRGEGKRT